MPSFYESGLKHANIVKSRDKYKKAPPDIAVGRHFGSANPVSRVLLRTPCGRVLYHLSTIAVTRNLQRPTPRHRASNPHLSVYMALQPVRRTAGAYRYLRGGLLPRLFTLTPAVSAMLLRPQLSGRFFSVTLLHPHGRQAVNLDGALRCSDFPPFATVVFGCGFGTSDPAECSAPDSCNPAAPIDRRTAIERICTAKIVNFSSSRTNNGDGSGSSIRTIREPWRTSRRNAPRCCAEGHTAHVCGQGCGRAMQSCSRCRRRCSPSKSAAPARR